MPLPVTYRRAGVEDLAALCQLGQILNESHHRARPDIYTPATENFARDEAHWLPSVSGDSKAVFLAEQGGAAVGFISCQVSRMESPLLQPSVVGRIGSIAVAPAMQGRGVGSALMQHAEAWARSQGATDIRLVVWSFNDVAMRLYRELGYEVRTFEMGKPLRAN